MKLTYVSYSPLDLQSANSIQTYNTCRELSVRLGRKLTVIAPRFGLRETAAPFPVVKIPRIPLNKLSRIFRTTLWSYLERSIYAWLAAIYLATHRADLVYSRDIICASWLILFRFPVVYETHDLESLHPSQSKGQRLANLMKRVDERTLRGARAAVSLTETFRQQLVAWGWQKPARVFVIPDAFDDATYYPRDGGAARARLGLAADHIVVAYAGMTFAYRRLDLLLAAFKAWGEPRARALIIGGRAPEVRELQAQTKRLGIAEAILWRGREPAAQAAEDLSAADILVIPDTVTDATASPLKMFEYMALGRAIVCVDRPALREILGRGAAEFFQPGNAADFARVLCGLAASPERRAELAAAAREQAADYTYGRRAEQIIGACRSVASC